MQLCLLCGGTYNTASCDLITQSWSAVPIHLIVFDTGLNKSTCHAGVVRFLGQHAAELMLLATRPEAQGNSLGPLLLAAIEHTCRALGVRLMVGHSRPGDTAVHQAQQAGVGGQIDGSSTGTSWQSELRQCGFAAACEADSQHLAKLPLLSAPGAQLLVKRVADQQVNINACLAACQQTL